METLPHRTRLDPRPAQDAARSPIQDAVNIPLAELLDRVYELPKKGQAFEIAGPPELAAQTQGLLESHGWTACSIVTALEASGPSPGRLWAPNRFLEQVAPSLKQGVAVDLGCGVGRDAVFLASLGWEVVAVDHLPDALARAQQLEARYWTERAKRIEWRESKLDVVAPSSPKPLLPVGAKGAQTQSNVLPPGDRNLESMADLVTLFFIPAAPYIEGIRERTGLGGSWVLETFTETHIETTGKPRRSSIITRDRLHELPGWRIQSLEEGWHEERHTLRAHLIAV